MLCGVFILLHRFKMWTLIDDRMNTEGGASAAGSFRKHPRDSGAPTIACRDAGAPGSRGVATPIRTGFLISMNGGTPPHGLPGEIQPSGPDPYENLPRCPQIRAAITYRSPAFTLAAVLTLTPLDELTGNKVGKR